MSRSDIGARLTGSGYHVRFEFFDDAQTQIVLSCGTQALHHTREHVGRVGGGNEDLGRRIWKLHLLKKAVQLEVMLFGQ
jgi:hypothetical protein